MALADQRRLTWVLALSGAAHAAVFALLAINHPQIRQAAHPPVFEVQVLPRYLPDRAAPAPRQAPLAARPIQPRRTLRPDEPTEVAPLVTPRAPAPPPAQAEGRWSLSPPTPGAQAAPPADLRNALRGGAVGCSNPGLLSKAERDKCLERLGDGAKDAPFIPPPMSRDKRRAFDAAAARKEAYREYKRGNIPPGTTTDSGPGQPPNPFPDVWTPHN